MSQFMVRQKNVLRSNQRKWTCPILQSKDEQNQDLLKDEKKCEEIDGIDIREPKKKTLTYIQKLKQKMMENQKSINTTNGVTDINFQEQVVQQQKQIQKHNYREDVNIIKTKNKVSDKYLNFWFDSEQSKKQLQKKIFTQIKNNDKSLQISHNNNYKPSNYQCYSLTPDHNSTKKQFNNNEEPKKIVIKKSNLNKIRFQQNQISKNPNNNNQNNQQKENPLSNIFYNSALKTYYSAQSLKISPRNSSSMQFYTPKMKNPFFKSEKPDLSHRDVSLFNNNNQTMETGKKKNIFQIKKTNLNLTTGSLKDIMQNNTKLTEQEKQFQQECENNKIQNHTLRSIFSSKVTRPKNTSLDLSVESDQPQKNQLSTQGSQPGSSKTLNFSSNKKSYFSQRNINF